MMGLLDGILKNIADEPDDLTGLAAKVGIDPKIAEAAIAALGKAHAEPGDTVEIAAKSTGLDAGLLNQIRDAVGGEASLSGFAEILDQDGDGNPLNDVVGMAGKLFGKK
jgi:hypothetical protein